MAACPSIRFREFLRLLKLYFRIREYYHLTNSVTWIIASIIQQKLSCISDNELCRYLSTVMAVYYAHGVV